jgi:hypothetical protein
VYPVYFTIDSGGGSLRSALAQANQYGGSIIAFTASGVIDLASPLPAILRDVQILGPGANILTVSGNGANPVFDVNAGVAATIAGLTIADGFGVIGGGMYNDGTLTVTNCTLSGNSSADLLYGGGGIFNDGTLTVTNSTLSGNSASSDGGGIYNDGTLNVSNSTLSGNSASSDGGGIYNNGGTLNVSDSTLSGNSASSQGGGIDNSGGTLNVTNSTLSGNSASSQGGGIANAGALNVTNSALSGNLASFKGGGIANASTLTITNSTLSGNSASSESGAGGGIENAGKLTVTNSTLSGNSAGFGGGIYNESNIYGIYKEGLLTVTNSTLSGNSAAAGGGINNFFGLVTLANTIIAGNTAPTGPDVEGPVTSLGYNLVGNASGGSGFVVADLLNFNPLLGPLQNNGGPTPTLALLPGSRAIAAGSLALAVDANGNPLTTDQRGSARTANGTVDIGAFESRGFTITVTSGNNQQTAVGTAFAAPLLVTVSSPYGEPVAGGVVTYTAPARGPSATFPGGSNTDAVNASDQAIIPVAANSTIGSYFVSASARGTAGKSFDLTNTPGLPTKLVIHTQPSPTATTGQAFPTQPVIYEEDQYGNVETGDNSRQVKVSLHTGSGPLVGTTTVTVAGGIATFVGLADKAAETIILVFTSPALAQATSNPITISSGSDNGQNGADIATVNDKIKKTTRAKNVQALRGASLPPKTKLRTRAATTQRQQPRQSSAMPAGEASSLEAVLTANRASAVIGADSAPLRVPARLKASLAAHLIALRYGGPDLN